MIASRRNFLAGFGSLLAAPAVVRADSLMHVRSIVKPYATVWGVGWDLEVIEHAVWTPDDALRFARCGVSRDGLSKFREVTEVVYAKPPSPVLCSDHWVKRVSPAKAFLDAEREKLAEWVPGNFVPTVGYQELQDNKQKQLTAMFKSTEHLSIRSEWEEVGIWV